MAEVCTCDRCQIITNCEAAKRSALTTLALLTEEELPGAGHIGGSTPEANRSRRAAEREIAAVARRYAVAYERSFFSEWRQPDPGIIPSLVRSTFRLDLRIDRQRDLWRKAARVPRTPDTKRFVLQLWWNRIAAMRTLSDLQKQRLMNALRTQHQFSEAAGDIEMVARAVEAPAAALETFREEFNAAFQSAMEAGAADAAQQVGFAADWTLRHPAAEEYMARYSGFYGDRLSRLVPMEWQSEIQRTIIRGLDEGQDSRQMTQALRSRFDGLQDYQALRIARTETVRAHIEGRRTAYAAMNVQTVEWITQGPPYVCPECAPLDGKQFPVDSPDLPPKHPNCFPGDVEVAKSGGLVPINTIQVGDFVLTGSGNREKVTRVWEREYEGDLISIETVLGYHLEGTPNHPVKANGQWVDLENVSVGDKVFLRFIGTETLYSDRVAWVTREPFAGTVYNLTVDKDATYTAGCIVVHNCNCDVSPPQSETDRLREEMFAELELPPASPEGEAPRPPTPAPVAG